MQTVRKVLVILFSIVAVIGFAVILGCQDAENWLHLLFCGSLAFFAGTFMAYFLNDPKKYYRYVYGVVAVVLAAHYQAFHKNKGIGRTLYLIKVNVGSYSGLFHFISDKCYYSDVNLEDYT